MNQLEQTRGQPPRVDFQIGMRGYTPFSSEKKKEKKKKEHALSQWNHSVAEYSALVSLSLFILPFNYYTVELPVLIRALRNDQIYVHGYTSWRTNMLHVGFVKFFSFKFKKKKKKKRLLTINDMYIW